MNSSAVRVVLALGILAVSIRADEPAASSGTLTSKEDALWRSILALRVEAPTSQPYDAWSEQARQRRDEQLRLVRSYITLYPGGAHRDEAIRLELELLYELSVLRGEEPAALRRRVSELLAGPASREARAEAAYWDLIADQALEPETSAPTDAVATRVAERLDGYRAYIQRYPASRYAPRLAARVFADAEARGRWSEARQLTAHVRRHFPDHPTTEWMRARLGRHDAVGRRVWLRTGRPTLVVVWAGYDAESRAVLPHIEAFRQAHPGVRVIGVSLNRNRDALDEVASAMEIPWPQSCDGLGWGGWFVRRWGTQRLPEVFVIDRDGRLVGIGGPGGWEALAAEAVATVGAADERSAN